MKIASFNINDIKRRLANLLTWLREGEPDIVCLRDLKAADAEFPAEANPASRLSCGLARRDALERRGNPCTVGARIDPCGVAKRLCRRPIPLPRSSGQGPARRFDLAPNGNPCPGLNSTTSSLG
jgi:hypothetical protein